jgi:hypothetical protein
MKLVLLLLLAVLLKVPASAPPKVRVTFSPLTKVAYEQARKTAVVTTPTLTFPLKKQKGRIVIPTTKGPKVFADKGPGTDETEQREYIYQGYLPQVGYHVVEAHLWERTQWYLVDKQGNQLAFYYAPIYSPDMKYFVVVATGIEYDVYPNEIRLFQFTNGRWRQVWKLEPLVEPARWEPAEIHWLSNSTLLLKKKMWTGKNPGTTFTYAKLTISPTPAASPRP